MSIINHTIIGAFGASVDAAAFTANLPIGTVRDGASAVRAGIRQIDGAILCLDGLFAPVLGGIVRRGPDVLGFPIPIPPLGENRLFTRSFTPNLNSTFCQSSGKKAPQ